MNKVYSRINWENEPSKTTPINETNLNKLDYATNEIDNRVITLDTTKFNTSEAQELVKSISFDQSSGIFTITYVNGTTFTIDTLLEKLAVNFDFDVSTQQLIIILDDGAKKYVDLSALLTQYEFLDSDTIGFTVDSDGKVSAIVKEGSIQEKHLQPNYLADIKVEVASAQASEQSAYNYSVSASKYANNSLSYAEQSKGYRDEASNAFGGIEDIVTQIDNKIGMATFDVNDDGELIYTENGAYSFSVDDNGYLNYSYS